MSERVTLRLLNPQQGYQELLRAWAWAKAMLIAGHRLVLELRKETRSDKQNRLLHSRLRDVSKHCEWAGAKRNTDTWKRLFTSAWLRTRGEQVELLPALDGHGVDIVYASTTQLTRGECVELSEYIFAWGSEREVPWCKASLGAEQASLEEAEQRAKPRRERIDAETGEITNRERCVEC